VFSEPQPDFSGVLFVGAVSELVVLVLDCLDESLVLSVLLSVLLSVELLSDVSLPSLPSFPSLLSLLPSLSVLSVLSVLVVVSTVSLELFLSFLGGLALVEEFFLDRLRLLPDELSLVELVSVELEDESSFLESLSSLESSFLVSLESSRSKDGVGGGL